MRSVRSIALGLLSSSFFALAASAQEASQSLQLAAIGNDATQAEPAASQTDPATSPVAPLAIDPAQAEPAQADPAQAEPAIAPVETPPTEPVQAAPAPAAAPLAGPDALARAAAVYATYQGDVTWVRDNPLSSVEDIERALNSLGTQNTDGLTRGWIAYSALVANQTPEFIEALRKADAYYGRDRMLRGLANDGRYARSFAGADTAVSRAVAAIAADSRRITSTGAIVKEQAYSLQSQGWAKKRFVNPAAKVELLSASALSGRPLDPGFLGAVASPDFAQSLSGAGLSQASLWEGVTTGASALKFPTLGLSGLSSVPIRRVRVAKDPVADRIATLAAFRALDASGPEYASQLAPILREQDTESCLVKAQLNLQQCVIAVHDQFEVPFCIGEYALTEIGNCLGDIAQ